MVEVRGDPADDAAIRLILEGTAQETGQEFFRALVTRLCEVLGTAGAWVTEYDEKQRTLTSLAFWFETDFLSSFTYEIAGTPCEATLQNRELYHVGDDIASLFPNDPYVEPFRAVSYLGMPLLDKNSRILGHLAVLDTKPLPKEPRTENLFRIFAARAAAELQRIQAESHIHDRETKLSLLINSAMDAILELDEHLKIIRVNPSGEKVFRKSASQMMGLPFTPLLTKPSADKLVRLTEDLRKGRIPENYIWVPGGFQSLSDQNQNLLTEGSLSRYMLDGKNFFTIILRDIRDQIEAERQIAMLTSEKEGLLKELSSFEASNDLIGRSEAWCKVLQKVQQVANSNACVLITGETGTGKEVIARAIHAASGRKDAPLIRVNCATIPESLIESEFFGHEKGAFTGAIGKRAGRFALADGGTMFLDEVGELPVDLQSKLLRVLQEGEFEPVGSSRTQKVDVRMIAATNRNLTDAIQKGRFREDLYYRLHVFPIEMPPLRERGEDVILLSEKFADIAAHKMDKQIDPLTPDSKRRLKAYAWPGNVRELQNVMERAVITSVNGRINLEDCLPQSKGGNVDETIATTELDDILDTAQIENLERQNILKALNRSDWRISGKNGAAKLLGIPPTTLSSRMKSLNIIRPS
jgi:PAS domain S-box-containing protein